MHLVLFAKTFTQCVNRCDTPLSLLAAWLSNLYGTGASVVFLRSALTLFWKEQRAEHMVEPENANPVSPNA